MLAQLAEGSPTFDMPEGGDSILYDQLAQGMPEPPRAYFHSPLYVWFLTGIYGVFGRDLLAARVVQYGLGVLSAVVVHRTAHLLFRHRAVAMVAGLAVATCGPLVFYEGHLLIDAVLPFLVAVGAHVAVVTLMRPSVSRAALLGVTIALNALGRATSLVWMVVTAIGLLRRRAPAPRGKHLLALVLGAVVVIAPVTLRNWIVERDFVLITANGGLNFYVGNGPRANGAYVLPPGMYFRPGDPSDDFAGIRTATESLGYTPSSSELSRWWTRRALDHLREHPEHAIGLLFKKTFLLVTDSEMPQLHHYGAYTEVAPLLGWLPTAGFVIAPALAALVIRLRRGRRRVLVVHAALALSYAAAFLPFFVVGRYRAPWLPLLAPWAAWACVALVAAVAHRNRRRAAALAGTIALFGAVVFAGPTWDDDPSLQHLEFARACERKNDQTCALHWHERAVEVNPANEDARLGAASIWLARGDPTTARAHVDAGLAAAPRSARLLALRGRLVLDSGDAEEATESARAAIDLAPSNVEAWLVLIRAMRAQGRSADAERAERSLLRLVAGTSREPTVRRRLAQERQSR